MGENQADSAVSVAFFWLSNLPFPFLTMGYRIFLVRILPLGQPEDFPRGLGERAGVPIMAITVPKP